MAPKTQMGGKKGGQTGGKMAPTEDLNTMDTEAFDAALTFATAEMAAPIGRGKARGAEFVRGAHRETELRKKLKPTHSLRTRQ